jgi:hypothetical protein
LSDAPASSDGLSSDVSSSSFIDEVSSSPPIKPSSPIDFSLEQLVRCSHLLRRPPDCYSRPAFTITTLCETISFREAILNSEWQHAMAEEIAALEQTGTCDLVPRPPRVWLITCKWVYKVKTRSDGSLEHYKARLAVIMMRLLLLLLI